MKIQVKNLGVLNEVEIDLKPLTIFVGPNNSGKTLLAYMLLAIFGQSEFDKYKKTLDKNKIATVYPPLDEVTQQLLKKGSAKIDLCQFADEYAEVCINDVAQDAKRRFAEFMQVDRLSFDNLEIKIILEQKKEQVLRHVLSMGVDRGLALGQESNGPLVNATKKSGDRVIYFYTTGSIENLPQKKISSLVLNCVLSVIHQGIYRHTYAFPTERTTFIVSTRNISQQRFSRIRDRETIENQNALLVSSPLSEFFKLMVSSINRGSLKRNDEVQNNPLIARYITLAQTLQKEILGGDLEVVSGDHLGISKKLVFVPKQDVVLGMNIVSSMVKELAALALYLKFSAQPGEWLIMDEPEMNLHPEAQVQLIELLAMLVNADLSLLLTTHSPYFVDHLGNLIKAYQHDDKDLIKGEFYLQRTEAFISDSNVAVYLFEHGTARNILGEDGIIEWGTFGRVSDRVTQIYFDL